MALLDLSPHLLADRISQPLRRHDRMGLGVFLASAARAVDHRRKTATSHLIERCRFSHVSRAIRSFPHDLARHAIRIDDVRMAGVKAAQQRVSYADLERWPEDGRRYE